MRIFTFLFFLVSTTICAQEITVLDVDTREPIVGAALYNQDKSKSAITNFDGVADISAFAKAELIIFSEVAHKEAQYTKAQIAAFGNKIFLKQLENQLGEIILSASKFAQSARNVPQKIIGISSENVAFANPQTAADLLESTGQVFVQKSQLGGGSPIIRGFSTNRLLITLDGIRFNTAIFRSGNVQNVISIDPFALDRTEVILGPGSVVYGSDAVGGVMNFYTKKPQFSSGKVSRVTGKALARYSSANTEKTGHFDFNIGLEKWSFLTSASFSDYDDQRMGSHGPDDYLRTQYVRRIDGIDTVINNTDPELQVGTGFSSYSLMQKVRFVPNEQWDFNLGVNYSSTSDTPRYDRLTQRDDEGNLRSAQWFYGPQRWLLTNFQINKEGRGSLYDRMQATIAYQYFEESRNDRHFDDDRLRTRTEHVNAYSTGLDFTKNLEGTRNKLFYGLEYVYNYINSNGSRRNIVTDEFTFVDTRYPDGSDWGSAAAYVSGQFAFSPTLNLNTGVRYNYIHLRADFSGNNDFFEFPFDETTLNFGNLTGSIGLNYTPIKPLTLKTNLSTAFRAPNIDDVGKIFDSGDGNLVVPNPDLKGERAYNAEVGGDIRFRESATNRTRFAFQANAYYTRLVDALVRRDFTLNGETTIQYQGEQANVQAIQNAGKATIYGLELGLEIGITKHIKFSSQYNLVEGDQEEEDGTKVGVRHVSPHFGNTHLIWQKNKWKLDAFAAYQSKISASDLSPEEALKPWLYALDANGNPYSPSWYTLNLTGQYQYSKAWQFTASLENITDQRYRTYSSGIAAAGRNLILSGRYRF